MQFKLVGHTKEQKITNITVPLLSDSYTVCAYDFVKGQAFSHHNLIDDYKKIRHRSLVQDLFYGN